MILLKQICFADWQQVVSALAVATIPQPPVPASKFHTTSFCPKQKNTAIGKISLANSEWAFRHGLVVAISPIAKPSLVAVETRRSNFGISALENCFALSLGIQDRSGLLPESGWADPCQW